jgi:hypothetical protein
LVSRFNKKIINKGVYGFFCCVMVQKKQYGKYNCTKVNALFKESPILCAARGQAGVINKDKCSQGQHGYIRQKDF